MNALRMTAWIALCYLGLSQFSHAQTNFYEIETGSVTVTPARCMPNECESTNATLAGTLSAETLPTLSFANLAVTDTPAIGFALPSNPNTSSNGTTREASFELASDGTLSVKGIVDSRAFDGPLYEYSFSASPTEPQGFDTDGYYTATQDLRKCVSPLCGGIFIKEVNKRFTVCADGSRARQCYIGTPNWDKLGFNPFAHAGDTGVFTALLLKGQVLENKEGDFGNLGEFVAEAAYRPATNNPARGRFVALENKGIYCITSPCFSIDQSLLNRDKTKIISGFNLNPVGASSADVDAAYTLFGNEQPILGAGYNKKQQELHGVGISFIANQFYLPIVPKQECKEGYQAVNGRCETPHGCVAPQIELTTIGGAPMIDPITGEPVANISYSCVDSCEFPAHESGPASCTLPLP